MGAVGGSVFHFIRGSVNSPCGKKILGGIQTMRMNAPKTGGGFAAGGGLFSTFDCGMVYIRQKEDPWNSIAAGAHTGGFLQMRQGVRAAGRSAAVGAVLFGMNEGAGIMLNRVLSPPSQVIFDDPSMMGAPGGVLGGAHPPGYPPHSVGVGGGGAEVKEGGGWLGGWFGGGGGGGEKTQGGGSSSGGGGSETKVLESFDTPTPMPSYDYK
ncbi:hypothetical protein RND81_11G037100 [Saponaria officinalis]|uniref:Mitochondrial import inner membrane translocase subunit TIM17-2-like n=1 Tax=Saponaria officinalis TaxID=3572 RepID=A0AAW1HJ67_SAPOF